MWPHVVIAICSHSANSSGHLTSWLKGTFRIMAANDSMFHSDLFLRLHYIVYLIKRDFYFSHRSKSSGLWNNSRPRTLTAQSSSKPLRQWTWLTRRAKSRTRVLWQCWGKQNYWLLQSCFYLALQILIRYEKWVELFVSCNFRFFRTRDI